jgi:hypothetical protein
MAHAIAVDGRQRRLFCVDIHSPAPFSQTLPDGTPFYGADDTLDSKEHIGVHRLQMMPYLLPNGPNDRNTSRSSHKPLSSDSLFIAAMRRTQPALLGPFQLFAMRSRTTVSSTQAVAYGAVVIDAERTAYPIPTRSCGKAL